MSKVTANTNLNLSESQRLSALCRAKVKECYRNAVMALLQDADLEAKGAVYVEGVYVTHVGIPLDHGWIETPDGEILDPTIPLILVPGEVVRYYAGVRYGHDAVMERAIGLRQPMPFYGVFSREVMQAHRAALLDVLSASSSTDAERATLEAALEKVWGPEPKE